MTYLLTVPRYEMTAELVVRDGRVAHAPPPFTWLEKKTVRDVARWAKTKGGTFEPAKQLTR